MSDDQAPGAPGPLPDETPAEMTASIDMLLCSNCGQPVLPTSRFCSSCGTPLVPLGDTSAMAALEDTGPMVAIDPELLTGIEPGNAVLIIHRGPEEGTRFELKDGKLSVGRAADATIFLDDVTVSRRHAEFVKGPDGWTISDTGSLNGTYVNKHRIETHLLASGEEVQIGKYRFLFIQVPTA